MREAQHVGSSAARPAKAKSATHSFSRGRKFGFHKNLPVSFRFSAEIPRFNSSTSRARRYTSRHTSNASTNLGLLAWIQKQRCNVYLAGENLSCGSRLRSWRLL